MNAAQPINYKALVPEFGVYSPYSPLIVAVEYLHGNSTPESAAFFREQLLINDHTPPHAPYLLMPSDEHVYMWKRDAELVALPEFVAPSHAVLQHYAPRRAQDLWYPSRHKLRVAFSSWLEELVELRRLPDPDWAPDQLLVRSGVYDQIHHGEIRMQEWDE